MSATGVDVGTNRLVSASLAEDGTPVFKTERDAFYRIVPKSEVNKNAIRTSLDKRGSNYIIEGDNFVVVGEEALHFALDRNDHSMRPMAKGVISPKDKANMPMLKLLLKTLTGEGNGEKLIYSVPGAPIDGNFDIEYHSSLLNMFFTELGFKPSPINEAFAIGIGELLDEGLTGITISSGAGMQNIAVIAQGDPIVEFATLKSGDYIDESVGKALDLSPSLVQLEKEAGTDLLNPTNEIMNAISVYYKAVINYTVKNIEKELKKRKSEMPVLRDKVPIVLSGGLAWANGYGEMFADALKGIELPFEVGDIRVVSNPDQAVAKGCLLAAQL
jgi:hypothetical protein